MDVVVSEAASATSSFSDSRIICRVCQQQFSQYLCPRCNTRYCSLVCYKGHSLRCTEAFTRENVMEELHQIQPEDETKRKMLDILKRFHAEEENMNCGDEDDSMLSEEIIQKVLSGNEIRLEDLSAEEIKEFRRAVASGELSKMIEPWIPWWEKPSARAISLSPEGTQLVKPLQDEETASESNLSEIPAGAESPLPPLCQLSRSKPSPLLSFHLVDIVYTYCFTLRLYNGDWQFDPLGAAIESMSLSTVLGEDGRPETVSEALSACLERTCSPVHRHMGGFEFAVGLVGDAIAILSLGNDALVCLLCDLRRIIQYGERMLKSEKVEMERRELGRKLRWAERKVYFLMCWVHEQPGETWSSLASIVEMERASLLAISPAGRKSVKAGGMRTSKSHGKVLIEELMRKQEETRQEELAGKKAEFKASTKQ